MTKDKEKEHTLARVLFRTANRTILLPVKVIIAPDLHKRKGKEKEPLLSHWLFSCPCTSGACPPRYACAAEAWADHDGPPFRLFPDGWEVYFGGRIRWRGTSPPLGGPGPYGQPVQEPQIRDRAQTVPYVCGSLVSGGCLVEGQAALRGDALPLFRAPDEH